MLAASLAAPAFASDNTGSTKETLTMNAEAQLSVTAPTRINYVLESDGTFTCPDADAVTVENHSAVPVAAKSWAADVKAGNAVEKADFGGAAAKNAWWNTAQPDSGEEYAFNLSQDELYDDWNMAADGQTLSSGQDDTVAVTTAGAMKNIDGSVDFNEAKQLSQVTWTFGTVLNGKGEPKPDPENGTAFAVYSADDNSLDFYKRNKLPKVGTEFNGKTVTNVYTGIETDTCNSDTRPWRAYHLGIKSVSVMDDGIAPVSTADWFDSFQKMTSCDLSKLDTSNVTDMGTMFEYCTSLSSLDLSSFDTSSVTTMHNMFENCYKLASLDLSGLDTSNVTDMSSMFYFCSSLTSLDVSKFDTSKVTDMYYMFSGCSSLASLDVSHFDTSKVTYMYYMFQNCTSLSSLDLSSWDTSKVTKMSSMFSGCDELATVKLGEKFAWVGTAGYLPAPNGTYITGSDGKWYAETDGAAYAPKDIPSNKADTYYASKSLLPQA